MDLIVTIPLAILGVVGALAAYGAWLIGQDSDAEAQAREMSGNNGMLSNGWFVLDWLRIGEIPVVTAIEDYLDHLREVVASLLNQDEDGDEGHRE